MNKGLLITGGIFLLIVLIFVGSYNGIIRMDENINSSWAQVENQLKRRADLIPNLVETAKGYAKHEEEVFTNLANARAGVMNAKTPGEHLVAEQQMNSALAGLRVVVEAYPELKANELFSNLQTELAGTENRIATERMRYNENVQTYNSKIRRFPTNIFAGMLGFEAREYFQITEAEKEVPKVQF